MEYLWLIVTVIALIPAVVTYGIAARVGTKYGDKLYIGDSEHDYSQPIGNGWKSVPISYRKYSATELMWWTHLPLINLLFAVQVRNQYLTADDYHDTYRKVYSLNRNEKLDDVLAYVEARRAEKLAAWEKELGITQAETEKQIQSVRKLKSVLTGRKSVC